MKYIVYLTKNIINGKIYVGKHKTEDPDIWDYYLGDGAFANQPKTYNKASVPFHAAICKYGPKNFRRTTLAIFNTEQEALDLEAAIVTEKFIRLKNTYNVVVGGGNPPILNKVTYQYDLKGNFIKEWFSVKEASETLNLCCSCISYAVHTNRSYGGFYWTRTKETCLNLDWYTEIRYTTAVSVYNEKRELLNMFESIVSAAKFYDFNKSSIAASFSKHNKVHGLYFIPNSKNPDEYFNELDGFVRIVKTPIYKYDLNTGDYIESFDSVNDAAKKHGLKSHSRIVSAAKLGKTSAGFRWSYYKVNNILKEKVSSEPIKPKKIGQYSLETGELLKVFDIYECRKQFPNATRVCRGERNKAHGYKWQYIYES